MKKIFLAFIALQLFLVAGCSSIEKDNRIRISGIVMACKQSPQLRVNYLNEKVKNSQISQIVAYTIQECLKNE